MHHAAGFQDWGPVLGIALIIAAAGVVLAIASIRAGQYRDPEAAKYAVVRDDPYPTDGEEQPLPGS
ncbi:MAG: cbb3-type cytochrome oxidase assembly protein [Armatimonadetes bacterium]|nr:cbb3-type cytochrome oxidase assembly protein [Armatimonadota bacterium]